MTIVAMTSHLIIQQSLHDPNADGVVVNMCGVGGWNLGERDTKIGDVELA